MKYKKIIEELENINESNFTMDTFIRIGNIGKDINNVYSYEVLKGKMDAKIRYNTVKELVNTIVFNKLKEKLGFEDEVINKIVYLLQYTDILCDIYVLDGNVIMKSKVYNNHKFKNVLSFDSLDGFIDITSKEFNNSNNILFKKFLIKSLNNCISPLIFDQYEIEELLTIGDDKIKCTLKNLSIYSNRLLDDITKKWENNSEQNTKIIIKYDDLLFYYDMKIRDGYIILARNDYKINSVKDMLNAKVKTKKL